MSTPGAEAVWRRWLVQKLTLTRWPRIRGESLEALAKRLLVQPEALRLAQLAIDGEYQSTGRRRAALGRVCGEFPNDLRQRLDLTVPPEVYRELHAYCRLRGTTVSALVRSLLHQMLLETRNPDAAENWIIHGQVLRIRHGGNGTARQAVLKTDLTPGAHRALVARARDAGVPARALLRGALRELLAGQRSVTLVRTSQMWDDEYRYVRAVEGWRRSS